MSTPKETIKETKTRKKDIAIKASDELHERFTTFKNKLKKEINFDITNEQLLVLLLDSYEANTLTFNHFERDLIDRAAKSAGETSDSLIKKGALLFAQKTISNVKKGNEPIDLATSRTAGAADMRVKEAVDAMMEENDNAANWFERKYINQRSLSEKTGANRQVIQRYLATHQEHIESHHKKHGMTEDHNRQVFNYYRVHGNNE